MTITPAFADAARTRLAPRSGGLLWAFHEGFASYVSRLADGRVDVDGGARCQPDGRILFPFAAASALSAGRESNRAHLVSLDAVPELQSSGSAHFTGHRGLLAVTLAEPAIVAGPRPAVLTITDPFSPGHRLVFAELGEVEPGVDDPGVDGPAAAGAGNTPSALRFAAPTLTEEGADLFLGHYREGTPLAPLEVLPAIAPSTDPTDPAEQDA